MQQAWLFHRAIPNSFLQRGKSGKTSTEKELIVELVNGLLSGLQCWGTPSQGCAVGKANTFL